MRRDELAEAGIDRRQRRLFHAGEIEKLVLVQDAEIGARAGLLRERMQVRQRFEAHAVAVERARGKRQGGEPDGEAAVERVLLDIALRQQRLHEPIGGRPRNAGAHRHLGNAERMLGGSDRAEQAERLAQAFHRGAVGVVGRLGSFVRVPFAETSPASPRASELS